MPVHFDWLLRSSKQGCRSAGTSSACFTVSASLAPALPAEALGARGRRASRRFCSPLQLFQQHQFESAYAHVVPCFESEPRACCLHMLCAVGQWLRRTCLYHGYIDMQRAVYKNTHAFSVLERVQTNTIILARHERLDCRCHVAGGMLERRPRLVSRCVFGDYCINHLWERRMYRLCFTACPECP